LLLILLILIFFRWLLRLVRFLRGKDDLVVGER